MKITFPHMGNIYLAVKALFDGLGIEYVIPPINNKLSLEIGSLHSPEEICLPFKLMIGNYIQAIEQGADTIVITGSCGPCRLGEYCEMQMKLLKKLGYNLDFIVLDAPTDIGIKELFRRINQMTSSSPSNIFNKNKAMFDAVKVLNLIDEIEASAHKFAGYEKINGSCKDIIKRCKSDALKCNKPSEMIKLLKNYREMINHVPVDINKNPLSIGIIGEIYTVIEPFSNLYIEDKLMDYGVSSYRKLTPSWWAKNTALIPLKMSSLDLKKASENYLPLNIGGHARECIGEAVLSHKEGFDGAIQIFPLGCMPEIVSKSILPTISKDLNLPIMTLVVDEMTGEAGFITRVEAFIDLLERRRENVLSGC
jgi:predicted nucleotide-binding protein (sugar kinase/HSP70/actin superfamily)